MQVRQDLAQSSRPLHGGGGATARERDCDQAADDERLLTRLAAGDRQALAVFYARHADAAFALAHEICGRAAQDVVEGAFLGLWRQARHGRFAFGQIRLLRLTRGRALDRLHAIGGRGPGGQRGVVLRLPSLIELSDDQARAVLARAAPAARQCLQLTYFDGLSIAEISATTQRPAAAVDDCLRRGIDAARPHVLAAHAAGGPPVRRL